MKHKHTKADVYLTRTGDKSVVQHGEVTIRVLEFTVDKKLHREVEVISEKIFNGK